MIQYIFLFIILLEGLVMATEEPKYRVVKDYGTFEVRDYAPYIVAQTIVKGKQDDMGSKAFKTLAGYIFGKNEEKTKMSMTAPVLQEDATSKKDTAIFSFVMPEKFSMQTLPKPINENIVIKQIDSKTVAALRYSGSWSLEKYKKNEKKLLELLEKNGFKTVGKPVFARYNSPFSLWFLRRNEVLVEVSR